jgi:hypothetical protein
METVDPRGVSGICDLLMPVAAGRRNIRMSSTDTGETSRPIPHQILESRPSLRKRVRWALHSAPDGPLHRIGCQHSVAPDRDADPPPSTQP